MSGAGLDLTYPRPGSTTVRDLVPRVMTQLVQRYRALPPGAPDTSRAAARSATDGLRGAGAAALGAALMAPTASVLIPPAAKGDPISAEALDLLVLFELAARGALTEPVVVPRPHTGFPPLPLFDRGVVATVAPEVTRVELSEGRVRTSAGGECDARAPRSVAGLEVTPAYVPIVDGVVLALTDNNPLTSVKLHPERDGNTLDLGGHAVEVWVARLREAFAIVEAHLPELRAEMRWLSKTIVPVGFHEERHASCSYEDAIGAIYLTLHPRPIKLAEAIVHEYQHNKLHALMRLDPLLEDAKRAHFDSPVRPDARPLEGVLLAAHAFLPVTRMYRSITASGDPVAQQRDWAETCAIAEAVHREALATLAAHAKPTKLGRALLAEMDRLNGAG